MPLLLVVLAFVGVLVLEIVVILQVGAVLGIGATIALMVATSLVGAWLLRIGGRRAFTELRRALAESRWPGDEVADGVLIIAGGLLLVTPGFVTDAVGLLTLVRPLRRLLARRMRSRGGSPSRSSVRGRSRGGLPLDVEVVEIQREQRPLTPPAQVQERGTDDPAGGGDARD